MNILSLLQGRFRAALAAWVDDSAEWIDMVRPSQDPKFGDYQANFAMPLGKRLGRAPRDVAAEVVARLRVDDFCEPPAIEGPGFINLRIKTSWLAEQTRLALGDERLGIERVTEPKTFIIDYSAPNVAKPMHVGHIRSTVIGDALKRTLRFLGHRVVGDNHLGDWGTQFGMIIYGYKHFLDAETYRRSPVEELSRLYRLVRQLVDYHEALVEIPKFETRLAEQQEAIERAPSALAADKAAEKARAKELRRAESQRAELRAGLSALQAKVAVVAGDETLSRYAREHAGIAEAVQAETAKLHREDPENLRLWREFLPPCRRAIDEMYRRLDVEFDCTLGESFYHPMLDRVVDELLERGLARESEGAICVFLPGRDAPMIVRKKDGAFLYATSDLATIRYRVEQWHPDAILYVVDHRQSGHFDSLFATARLWDYAELKLVHVSFGTVLGPDGKPYKTRSGDTIGLESLLDEAVRRAEIVVSENNPGLSPQDRARIAEVVGIGALKYADLSQNRTSDYEFSYDKMLQLNGNTATYMQYAYARVKNIFVKGEVDIDALRGSAARLQLAHPAERALALEILRFVEALDQMLLDYRPNVLTSYLFALANRYSTFYENCPVIKAETAELRSERYLLCDLTAQTLKQGLALLGIQVVEKM